MFVGAFVYLPACLVDRTAIRRGGIVDLEIELDDLGRSRLIARGIIELAVGTSAALIRGARGEVRI